MAEQHNFFVNDEPVPEHLVKVEDAGYWDGDRFVFTPPVMMVGEDGDGNMVTKPLRVLDLSGSKLEPGISRDDVISAFLNPMPSDEGGSFISGPSA